MTTETLLSKEEFVARFKARMVSVAGEKFEDGESISEYADETAPTYYEDQYLADDLSPEECADADMTYWGDD